MRMDRGNQCLGCINADPGRILETTRNKSLYLLNDVRTLQRTSQLHVCASAGAAEGATCSSVIDRQREREIERATDSDYK